jgi:hypothetical protein
VYFFFYLSEKSDFIFSLFRRKEWAGLVLAIFKFCLFS